jgi:uncharacterized protein
MDMKFAKYLCKFDRGDKWLIYNAYTNKAIIINKELFNVPEMIDDNVLNSLKKDFFILPDSFNELEIIRQILSKKIHDKFSVVYIPTFKCNLKCDYCYQQYNNYHNENSISYYDVVKWIANNISINTKEVNIQFYGGEPLLEKELIFNFLDKLGVEIGKEKLCICMCTNGFYLTKEFLFTLERKCRISEIQLTVHDFDKNPNNYHMTVIKNIREIILENKWILTLKFDINCENGNKILDFLLLLNIKVGYSITIAPILDCGSHSAIKLCEEDNMAIILDIQRQLIDMDYKVNKRNSYICHLLINPDAFVIDPQGYIYKCDSMAGTKEFAIGSIREYKVNSSLINLKETYLLDLWNQPDECFECDVMPMCMGNCRYRNKFNSRNAKVCYREMIKSQLLEEIEKKDRYYHYYRERST